MSKPIVIKCPIRNRNSVVDLAMGMWFEDSGSRQILTTNYRGLMECNSLLIDYCYVFILDYKREGLDGFRLHKVETREETNNSEMSFRCKKQNDRYWDIDVE